MSNITLENWENARGEQPRRRRGPKPVAQGQLLKATAWLDGDFVWHEGALGWRLNGQTVVADGAQIERAGRALDKLEARGVQREAVAARREKWVLARALGALQARDLDKLCAVSRRRNPAALKRLAPLLVLEALDVELPHSPARALLLAWPHSQPALESVLSDAIPSSARELAAFIIGAAAPQEIARIPKLLRGVAASGARFGSELKTFGAPTLLLRAARENEALVARIIEQTRLQTPFAPDVAALARLARAHGIERALEIGDELARLPDIWPEFPDVALWEDRHTARLVREMRVLWRAARRDWSASCRAFLPQLAARDADAIAPFMRLSRALIGAAGEPLRYDSPKHRAPFVRDVKTLVFAARATAQLASWSLLLGHESLAGADKIPDIAGALELWHDVAQLQLNWALAPGARSKSGKASDKWVNALQTGFSSSATALKNILRAGNTALARCAWERKSHHGWSSFWSESDKARWPQKAALESWAALLGELPALNLSPWEWDYFRRQFEAPLSRALIREMLDIGRVLAPDARARYIEGLVEWVPSKTKARAVWPHFAPVLRAIVPLLASWQSGLVDDAIDAIADLCARAHELGVCAAQWPAIARAALENYNPETGFSQHESRCILALRLSYAAPTSSEICALFQSRCEENARLEEELPRLRQATSSAERAAGTVAVASVAIDETVAANLNDFRATLMAASRLPDDDSYALDNALPGARIAAGRPQLARALRYGLEIAPARALKALEYLAALRRSHQLDTLQTLETPAPALSESWCELASISPHIAELARDYARWQSLANEAATPPPGALKIADWPRKWAREISALQSRAADNPHLRERLNNLRVRLEDEPKWRAQQAQEIAQLLENATKRAAFSAIEAAIEAAFRARLQTLCGALPADFAFDDDWFNALLLGSDVEYNRKWARALLRHEVAGDADWRQNLPGNARFLRELEGRGVDTHFYQSEFGRAHGELWLWIENAPLGILQMGNRFNTCLSRGGCNAFAGVSNAIELNKRVVYARDKKGTIVARQLWAISEDYKLVGFDVYSTYAADERAGLEAYFAAHAREWARSCGLQLADEGEIEKLVAPEWYDDGVRAWESEARDRKLSGRDAPRGG